MSISVLTSIAKQMFVCVLSLQHVSSCECPGMDESFEPLTSMTLLQQSRQNNLEQQQLQRQLTNGSIAAVTGNKHNVTQFTQHYLVPEITNGNTVSLAGSYFDNTFLPLTSKMLNLKVTCTCKA